MKLTLLTFFILAVFCGPSTAQKYQFKKYTMEEGLVNNETYAILQDNKNRIWVTSTGGVSCFNGKTFTNYTTENGLASNICFGLFEDSKGRIWVGTLNNGVSFIENGKITNPKGVDFSLTGTVTCFLEDSAGIIYIFFTKGIATFKNGKLDYLTKETLENKAISFQSAAWYDANTIYIASASGGIYRMTLNPYKLENIYNEKDGINNICYSVFVDGNKDVWVGAYGELYKISHGKLTKYKFNPEDFDLNRVYDIYEENENEFYLAFEGNGFGIFNKQTGGLKIFNEKQGLPTKYVYKIIMDTEGNHWMTSYGEGIIRFRDTSFKLYDDSQGLPSKSVTSTVEWNGDWIVATDAGAVTLDANDSIKPFIKNTPVNNLFVTPEQNLLLSTDEKVLEISKNGNSKLIDEGAYNLLYKDKERTFLFGTDKIKILERDSTYFIKTRRSIAMEPLGDRFILCKISSLLQLKDNKIDTIPGMNPLEHYDFRSIDNLNENGILVGSEKKLYHITLSGDNFKIQSFDMKRFAPLHHFRALKVDGNNLWMAGRDLISKVDLGLLLKKDSISAINYATEAHFLANDVDLNSLLVTKDKTVLATSLSGLLVFNEDEYTQNPQPPKLDISSILLFSEPFNDSLYRAQKGIVLPYQKNYLTFNMEAITYTNPEKVKYKYRLKGLRNGDEWSPPTKDPQVVFSYLPPGNYTFEFTADNGNGVWQESSYKYSFTIKVPFWKTWLFWFAFLITTAGTIILFIFAKNRKERNRREAFTQGLIKAQEGERIRVARELHDSVGQKLMLLTKKTKDTGNTEMESLAGNTLEELRSISRGLHPSNLEKLGITAAIKNLINEVDAHTSIFFTHEIEDIDDIISKEASLHLYRIIQEVLSNMVKHADAKSASVTVEKRQSSIEATIKDNGKGFEYSEKTMVSGSLGMNTLAERARILRSKIDIKSQIGKGTTIKLIIPT